MRKNTHASALGAVAHRSVQLELPFGRRQSTDTLTRARAVTVESIVRFINKVTVLGEGRNTRVFINDKPFGLFDKFGGMPRTHHVQEVHGIALQLPDGQTCMVFHRGLTVIAAWRRHKEFIGASKRYVLRWQPEKKVVMSRSAKLRLDREITWSVANQLNIGDSVSIEYPFQWVRGQLTNGEISFPPVRPTGKEWAKYPVPAVPAECWDDFLDVLEGKFLRDVLPTHSQVTTKKREQVAHRQLTRRQNEVARIVRGSMWKGNGCEQVIIGRNVVFLLTRADGTALYLVDNSGVGALYAFDDEAAARNFASGATTRSAAIKSGARRIVHAGAWQARVNALAK